MRWAGRRITGRRDSGAAAVEFALLFPLFLALVFGIINFGFAFNQKINLTQTAREAARYGATLSLAASAPGNTGDIDTWLAKVRDVAISAGGDDLSATRANRYICVAYVTADETRSLTVGTGGPSTNQPCFDDDRDDDRVQVHVKSNTVIDVLLFGGDITIASESVTHFEAAAPS